MIASASHAPNKKKPPPSQVAASTRRFLLLSLVYAIAGLGLGGLDLEAVLLGGGREKSPDRMFLPIRGFHDLGQARPLRPPDQFQDLCALALGARRAVSLAGAGLAFLPALAPFFWLAPFFEEVFSGATCPPCSATVAALSLIVASTFVTVILLDLFCAWLAHDDSSLGFAGNASEKWPFLRQIWKRRTAGDGRNRAVCSSAPVLILILR